MALDEQYWKCTEVMHKWGPLMQLHQEDSEKMVQLHAQAEVGDADYAGREAGNESSFREGLRGMSRDEAKKRYVDLTLQLFRHWVETGAVIPYIKSGGN